MYYNNMFTPASADEPDFSIVASAADADKSAEILQRQLCANQHIELGNVCYHFVFLYCCSHEVYIDGGECSEQSSRRAVASSTFTVKFTLLSSSASYANLCSRKERNGRWRDNELFTDCTVC
jgi:hypothetical protein